MNANLKRGLLVVGSMAISGLAMAAAGDDPGLDAINELGSKATIYIVAATAAAVVISGGFWSLRMMKKAFSKAG